MKTRYYRYTLQGEHSAADAQNTLGDAASHGLIVRVDTVGGRTHIYIASERTSTEMKSVAPRSTQFKEVPASAVTKIG